MAACMPSQNEITQLIITGEWSSTRVSDTLKLCLDTCSKLATIMRACLKEATSGQ